MIRLPFAPTCHDVTVAAGSSEIALDVVSVEWGLPEQTAEVQLLTAGMAHPVIDNLERPTNKNSAEHSPRSR